MTFLLAITRNRQHRAAALWPASVGLVCLVAYALGVTMLTADQAQFVSVYRAPQATKPTEQTTLPSRQISAIARDQLGMVSLKGQQRDVLDIVLAASRNGVADLSGREIQARYRQTYPGRDIDTGTVSARVNSLIAAKLLERCPDRLCSITGKTVGPVRPVAQQARMVG